MAKKAPGLSKTPPKSEARPLGTKKAAPKPKAAKAKKGEREAKPSEIDIITNRRDTVIRFLVARDGMEEELAAMVVDGLEPEQIADLWQEAEIAGDGTAAPEPTSNLVPEAQPEIREFIEIPALAASAEFPVLVMEAIEAAKIKNAAEKAYKAAKAKVIEMFKDAGIEYDESLMAFGNKLTFYQGNSPKQLDELKLVEKGVSVDIIAKCWKSTKYDDIRFTPPKEQ